MTSLPAVVLAVVASATIAARSEPAALAADAPAPLKVLRHMTFDSTYDSQSTIQTKVSGLDGGPASGLASNDGPATTRRGTISVDVVAATADGGLAVDISEDRAAPVRVGIMGTNLLINPSSTISEEEQTVLRYLARGFVQAGELTAGATWTSNTKTGAVSDQTTYTVTSVDADAQTITLAIKGSSSATGTNAFDATTTGTMTYNIHKVVPLKLDITTRTNVARGDRLATVVAHVSSTLHDDTF